MHVTAYKAALPHLLLHSFEPTMMCIDKLPICEEFPPVTDLGDFLVQPKHGASITDVFVILGNGNVRRSFGSRIGGFTHGTRIFCLVEGTVDPSLFELPFLYVSVVHAHTKRVLVRQIVDMSIRNDKIGDNTIRYGGMKDPVQLGEFIREECHELGVFFDWPTEFDCATGIRLFLAEDRSPETRTCPCGCYRAETILEMRERRKKLYSSN